MLKDALTRSARRQATERPVVWQAFKKDRAEGP
jgi:hypothetical protein